MKSSADIFNVKRVVFLVTGAIFYCFSGSNSYAATSGIAIGTSSVGIGTSSVATQSNAFKICYKNVLNKSIPPSDCPFYVTLRPEYDYTFAGRAYFTNKKLSRVVFVQRLLREAYKKNEIVFFDTKGASSFWNTSITYPVKEDSFNYIETDIYMLAYQLAITIKNSSSLGDFIKVISSLQLGAVKANIIASPHPASVLSPTSFSNTSTQSESSEVFSCDSCWNGWTGLFTLLDPDSDSFIEALHKKCPRNSLLTSEGRPVLLYRGKFPKIHKFRDQCQTKVDGFVHCYLIQDYPESVEMEINQSGLAVSNNKFRSFIFYKPLIKFNCGNEESIFSKCDPRSYSCKEDKRIQRLLSTLDDVPLSVPVTGYRRGIQESEDAYLDYFVRESEGYTGLSSLNRAKYEWLKYASLDAPSPSRKSDFCSKTEPSLSAYISVSPAAFRRQCPGGEDGQIVEKITCFEGEDVKVYTARVGNDFTNVVIKSKVLATMIMNSAGDKCLEWADLVGINGLHKK